MDYTTPERRLNAELSIPFTEAWEQIRQYGTIHEPETVYTEDGGFYVASAHIQGTTKGYAQLVGRWSGDEHAPHSETVTLQVRVLPKDEETLEAYLQQLPIRRAAPAQP